MGNATRVNRWGPLWGSPFLPHPHVMGEARRFYDTEGLDWMSHELQRWAGGSEDDGRDPCGIREDGAMNSALAPKLPPKQHPPEWIFHLARGDLVMIRGGYTMRVMEEPHQSRGGFEFLHLHPHARAVEDWELPFIQERGYLVYGWGDVIQPLSGRARRVWEADR